MAKDGASKIFAAQFLGKIKTHFDECVFLKAPLGKGCLFLLFSFFLIFYSFFDFCWLFGFCWLLASVGFWLLLTFWLVLASVGCWLCWLFDCWLFSISKNDKELYRNDGFWFALASGDFCFFFFFFFLRLLLLLFCW